MSGAAARTGDLKKEKRVNLYKMMDRVIRRPLTNELRDENDEQIIKYIWYHKSRQKN